MSSLDGSLREFLRADVPLRAEDVDIEFGTPNKEWSSRLTRSTVNLFLFDIRRSVNRAITGLSTREVGGNYTRAFRAPMIKVRYLVTVWTAEPADEHRVLGDLLRLVAVSSEVPEVHLAGDLINLGNPVELALGAEDGTRFGDLWGPLGVAPRACLELIVTVPASGPLVTDVPKPPEEVGVGLNDRNQPSRESRTSRRPGQIDEPTGAPARSLGPTETE